MDSILRKNLYKKYLQCMLLHHLLAVVKGATQRQSIEKMYKLLRKESVNNLHKNNESRHLLNPATYLFSVVFSSFGDVWKTRSKNKTAEMRLHMCDNIMFLVIDKSITAINQQAKAFTSYLHHNRCCALCQSATWSFGDFLCMYVSDK